MTTSHSKGIAVITGASSGIGAVYADRFASQGHPLLVVARRTGRLEELAENIKARHGVEVETLTLDLVNSDALLTLEKRLESDNIDILVNNAGTGGLGPTAASVSDKMEAVIRLNIVALTRLSKAVLTAFQKRGTGTLINIGSVVAFGPSASSALYSGSKSYVLNFTRGIAAEYENTDIRAQVVMPGPVRTEFFSSQGISDSVFPAESYVSAENLVDAALAGLALGEIITTPTVESQEVWAKMESARSQYFQSALSGKIASRYV